MKPRKLLRIFPQIHLPILLTLIGALIRVVLYRWRGILLATANSKMALVISIGLSERIRQRTHLLVPRVLPLVMMVVVIVIMMMMILLLVVLSATYDIFFGRARAAQLSDVPGFNYLEGVQVHLHQLIFFLVLEADAGRGASSLEMDLHLFGTFPFEHLVFAYFIVRHATIRIKSTLPLDTAIGNGVLAAILISGLSHVIVLKRALALIIGLFLLLLLLQLVYLLQILEMHWPK